MYNMFHSKSGYSVIHISDVSIVSFKLVGRLIMSCSDWARGVIGERDEELILFMKLVDVSKEDRDVVMLD
jgi:hypothetical protein